MKFTLFPLMAALAGPVLLFSASGTAEAAPGDGMEIYKAGKTAFYKGDYVTAKTAFAKLLKADPDFLEGKIYMKQIRLAEEKWAARPRTQKISETARMGRVEFWEIPLSDALELVRREVEKAGANTPNAGPVVLLTDLPAGVLSRTVSLAVKDVPMQWWVDAVGYAGGVRIAWDQKGISVTAAADSPGPDAATAAAIRSMRERAESRILPRVSLEKVSVADALVWLGRQTAEPSKGPLIVSRAGIPQAATVSLDLRHVTLSDAIRSVALVADLEVDWEIWGAGMRSKVDLPAPQPVEVRLAL